MTDNNGSDDLNHVETEAGDEFAQPRRGIGANLASAWRTKPLFKLVVIAVAAVSVVAVATSFITPEKENPAQARVVTPPDIHQAPGGPVSPYMKRQTDLANKSRSEDALKNGGSSLPTPQGGVTDLGELEQKHDPLSELRLETQHLKDEMLQVKQAQKQQQVLIPQQQPKPDSADDTLATAMQHELYQFQGDNWKVHGIHVVTAADDAKTDNAANGNSNNGAPSSSTNSTTNQASNAQTLIQAGSVSYAQLLIGANSDIPGPIMAQIVSGPLAGARVIGNFETKNELLALHFSTMNFKHKDYSINAYAIDPDTTLPGMATDVDHRYFTRVVLPAAAAFLEGVGQTIGQAPQAVVDNGQQTLVTQSQAGFKDGVYEGLGKAATTAGEFFDNQANMTHVLVVVASGTPMGVFFLNSVKDDNSQNPSPSLANDLGRSNNFGSQLPYPGAASSAAAQQANSVPYPNYASPSQSNVPSLMPVNTGYSGPMGYGANTSPYGTVYGH